MPLSVVRRVSAVESKVSDLSAKAVAALARDSSQQQVLNNNSAALNQLGTRVNQLENNVTSLALVTAPEVAQNSNALAVMTSRISANEHSVETLQQSVTAIQCDVVTRARQSDLTAASAAVAALTDHLNATNASLTSTNTSLTALTMRVTAAEGSIGNTNTSLTSLTNRVTAAEGVAAAAAKATDLATTNTNVSNLTTSTTNAQNTLNARVSNLESSLPTYAKVGDLNTTNSNVTNLTSRVTTDETILASQGVRLSNLESTSVNDIMRGWVSTPSVSLRSSKILSMASDPSSGVTLLVDAAGYVYRSYDGCLSITQVYSVSVTSTTRIVYGNGAWVICRHAAPQIYSTDNGSTWITGSITMSGCMYRSSTNQWVYVAGFGSGTKDLIIGTCDWNFGNSTYNQWLNYFPATGVTLVDMCLNAGNQLLLLFSSTAGAKQMVLATSNYTQLSSAWNYSGYTAVSYSSAGDMYVAATTTAGTFAVSGRTSTTYVTDPTTWATVSVPDLIGVPRCIAYSGTLNLFVAAGDVGNKQTSVIYSTNGLTWSPSYTFSVDTRIPSSIVYDTANDLWLMAAYVSGTPATVFASVTYPSSYTHRKVGSVNVNLKTLTGNYNNTASTVGTLQTNLNSLTTNYNSTASTVSTLQTNLNTLTTNYNSTAAQVTSNSNTISQLASGFCSSLKDSIYHSMAGLGPVSTQVNIEYHWTRVLDTVSLTGRIVIPGPVETTAGSSTGFIKFYLPVAITGSFSSPGTVTYTFNNGTNYVMTRYNPRLLGHVFMDNKAQQALVDNWEIYGEPGTSNVATIYVADSNTYGNSCFWFQLAYKLSPINYSTSITNQTTNTTPATV